MADTQTAAPESTDDTEPEDEARRPYVVVLMSAEMKAALKEYATAHETNPTALARKLLADTIGYDISSEPTPTRRSVYTSEEQRVDAKKAASKKSGLLRKALFQGHSAQLHNRPKLFDAAQLVIGRVGGSEKLSIAQLDELDRHLDLTIKAGK